MTFTDSIIVTGNPTTRTYQPNVLGFQPRWLAVLNLSAGTVYAQYYVGTSEAGPNALEWTAGLYYALSLQPTGAGGAVQVIIDGGTTGKQIIVTLSDAPMPVNPGNFGAVVISGSVTVTGTVTVSGTVDVGTMPNVTINNSSGSPLYVSVTSAVSITGTVTVSGTVNIGTMPSVTVSSVTGTVTVSVSNTITVTISGNGNTIIIGNTTGSPGYIQAASGEFDTQSSFDYPTNTQLPITLIASGNYVKSLGPFSGNLNVYNIYSSATITGQVVLSNGGTVFWRSGDLTISVNQSVTLVLPTQPFSFVDGTPNSGIVIDWYNISGTTGKPTIQITGYGVLVSATPPQKTAVVS